MLTQRKKTAHDRVRAGDLFVVRDWAGTWGCVIVALEDATASSASDIVTANGTIVSRKFRAFGGMHGKMGEFVTYTHWLAKPATMKRIS